jgi:hypothetical protein
MESESNQYEGEIALIETKNRTLHCSRVSSTLLCSLELLTERTTWVPRVWILKN